MLLDHLTTNKIQIGVVSALDLLTALNTFLLSCRVDGLSPATLNNYQYQLGRFVKFCNSLVMTSEGTLPLQRGACAPLEITTQHIRLFLLNLRETNSPVSVGDYYKAIRRFFNYALVIGL